MISALSSDREGGMFDESPRIRPHGPNYLDDLILKHNPYYSDKYEEAYRRSMEDPEDFWTEVAQNISWSRPWDRVFDDSNQPFTQWFVGGELNACYNALDRHIDAGRGGKVALIHDSPLTKTVRHVTYLELHEKVSRLAGTLAYLGVEKGDRVLIYMPLIPEAIMAMLATARLGAIHTVVFGGFAAKELHTRIEHSEPKVIIAASSGVEPNKIVRYKDLLNEALAMTKAKPRRCIIFQRHSVEIAELDPEMDLLWDLALRMAPPHPCVPVEANEPLYIIYTSGTTGEPKGIVRPIGGHLVALAWTLSVVYGMGPDDVWWTASDIGWVVGHSYICYGPLISGVTSVMYEGKPDRTPDAGQYFRVIHEHKVNGLLTAPTALRVIRREDSEVKHGKKFSTDTLRYLFVAGEHCDQETKAWAEKTFKVPILNHWWQTETGHSVTATCVGLDNSINPPKFSAGMPLPGYDVRVLRTDGSTASVHETGRIALKLPMPPGTLSCLYNATERFKQLYFSSYPGYYDTMDAGYIDEFGYVYVTARDDDIINVSGIRLSTALLEDVVLSHPDICDATVVGVPEPTKGKVPLCLYVLKKGTEKTENEINRELTDMVRKQIGPIATINRSAAVRGLPRTRSGKVAKKSIADLATNKFVKIAGTIEDPSLYKDVKKALQILGYARMAPDPQ